MNYNYKTILPFVLLVVLLLILLLNLLLILYNSFTSEGFTNNTYVNWSPDLIRRFNIYQTTMNDNVNQFDLNILQKQATPEEAEHLLNTGYWPWPDDLKREYINQIWSSTIIKIDPQIALNYAMSVYNQNAARQLLAWNTKEGQFLLYGGDLGPSDVKNMHNTIKCVNDFDGNSKMQKKVYTGMNLWNGFTNTKVTDVKPEDIPNEMPGFSFINRPCNPCAPFNSTPDFSCPFRLNIKGDNSVSLPWKQLWGL